MRPLVFWQNIPSIHQAPLARALGRCWDGQVLVVTEEDVPARRLDQGWSPPAYDPAKLLVAPDRATRRRLLEQVAGERAVHVFSGLRAYPETTWTLKRAVATDGLIGVFLEPLREDDAPRSVLRGLMYRFLAVRWRPRLDFLLVTGEAGMGRYRELGFPEDRMFSFCYTVTHGSPPGLDRDGPTRENRGDVRLLFVGHLASHKGLHLLLEALATLESRRWTLDVIGRGPDERSCKAQSEKLGLSGRIRWRGPLANDETRLRMATTDIVILPSLHDGWGAVVNEAVIAGARVLVSTACGAAALARHSPTGRTFRAGSSTALAHELGGLIDLGPVLDAERSGTRMWAGNALAPCAVARYLREIIGFIDGERPRPSAPWIPAPVSKS